MKRLSIYSSLNKDSLVLVLFSTGFYWDTEGQLIHVFLSFSLFRKDFAVVKRERERERESVCVFGSFTYTLWSNVG